MACEFEALLPGGITGAVDAACAALDEIDRLEEKLSVYRDGSDLSYLNRAAAAGPVPVDAEMLALLASAHRIGRGTDGAFDPACGALVKAWGFFRGPLRVPPPEALRRAREASGIGAVEIDVAAGTVRFLRPGVEYNLGGIGKGYALDRAAALLRREFGIRRALLQGGQSSLRGVGAPPGEPRGWPVAIADPLRPGHTLATIHLRDRALGTSGTANQYFVWNGRRYGHVLDPRTGFPADSLAGASAIAPTALEADALSTAFFVLGEEGARAYCRAHPQVGAVLVLKPQNRPAPRVVLCGAVDAEAIQ